MKIIRPKELITRLGISKSTLYRMIRAGDLPPKHRISKQVVGWLESDIAKWLQDRMDGPTQTSSRV